jgi:four helix bundle protein
MTNEQTTIKSFTDLRVWREGHKLVIAIYDMTKDLPKHEQFGLTSQMQRAAVSITSNIAEGFSRNSYSDKTHFYTMAHGSLTELQNQLYIAKDVGYINEIVFESLMEQANDVYKILAGLIRATKERK